MLRVIRMYAADVRDGWEVRTSSLVAAVAIAALTRRTFRIDRAVEIIYTAGGVVEQAAVPYVFDKRC